MKIKSLLIGMLACSAMVACTNEDPIDNGNENPAAKSDKAYLAVKLVDAKYSDILSVYKFRDIVKKSILKNCSFSDIQTILDAIDKYIEENKKLMEEIAVLCEKYYLLEVEDNEENNG